MRKYLVVGSVAAITAACVTLLAGRDDIRRFVQMRNM